MSTPRPDPLEAELQHCFDALCGARARAGASDGATNMPSLGNSRELIRLFIQIESDDVRHALLHLMRTIAGPPR